MRRSVIIAIFCAAFSVMLAMGIRASFGLFLQPVSDELGTGREVFSLAMAISNLLFGLPIIGLLSDWIGPRLVLAVGGVFYAAGLAIMTTISSPGGLYGTLGLLIGFALSATTFVVVLGAVAPMVPPEQRSRTFGIITGIGSSGMFVIPPAAQYLLSNYGWQWAFLILAAVSLLIILLAFGLPGKRAAQDPASQQDPAGQQDEVSEPFIQILKRAQRHSGYLLLTTGFFVCGFHVAFIGAHLPAFLTDQGLESFVAAGVLSLIGGFNMVGSFTFGWLGDHYRKKHLLSFLYLARAVVITIFILLPITKLSAFIFGGTIGFLWLATVPLTSGTVAQIFGTRYLSTLYGIVFFSHQIGAFLGVWLGGRIYDATGSYMPIWYAGIALGVLAAIVHMPISDEPVVKLQPAAAGR